MFINESTCLHVLMAITVIQNASTSMTHQNKDVVQFAHIPDIHITYSTSQYSDSV